jgi:hypothetical protein
MTYKADPIHTALDKAAEITGVPKLNRKAQANQRAHRPRRQFLLPLIALAGSIAAFVATITGIRFMGALAPLFFVLAMLAQQFGPVRSRNAAMPYDECEQLLIWRSRSIGMGAALGLAIIGCAAFAVKNLFQDLVTNAPQHIPAGSAQAAMWLLTTTATALTTISASWLLPKDIGDEGEVEDK